MLDRLAPGADRERGATATIVAILLSGGVIMGMLAVSVDLGNLTYERRQVQNGADATSMALAAECAGDKSLGQPACDPDEVDDLLGANSRDGLSQYDARPGVPDGACARPGVAGTGSLSKCPSTGAIDDLGECPPLPEWLTNQPAIPYVETYAATEVAGGGDKLFLPFSRVLAGGASGDAGTSACARAAWGQPANYSATVPLTFSSCEWWSQTSNGTNYVEDGPSGALPGYGGADQPAWPTGREVAIQLHDPGNETEDCTWNGKDTAGGFGWLDEKSDDCQAEVTDNGWAHTDTGNNVPQPCKDVLPTLWKTVIEIPVFDCIVDSKDEPASVPTDPAACDPTQKQSSGNNTWYHIEGWAKFYVSGYTLPGATESSVMPGGLTCGSGGKCITGWFLTGQLSGSPDIAPPGSGTDFGTYVVKPAG
ncbi:hypothetical protein ASG73_03695 [Janibacter sp. Soil728]|nr:hypothetical protein ASG73_03695 [Janibacter sp. Soil728]